MNQRHIDIMKGRVAEPVTPETLTDEMVRAEWLRADKLQHWKACQRILDCDTVLHRDGSESEIRAARQRICDAINAAARSEK